MEKRILDREHSVSKGRESLTTTPLVLSSSLPRKIIFKLKEVELTEVIDAKHFTDQPRSTDV